MSKRKPVMSHDPLAEVPSAATGKADTTSAEDSAPAAALAVLDSSLTIADVSECHTCLRLHLQGEGALQLDGGAVEMIDGAGLQLLAACVKQAREQGREVRWQHISDPLALAAHTLGVAEALALDRA